MEIKSSDQFTDLEIYLDLGDLENKEAEYSVPRNYV